MQNKRTDKQTVSIEVDGQLTKLSWWLTKFNGAQKIQMNLSFFAEGRFFVIIWLKFTTPHYGFQATGFII